MADDGAMDSLLAAVAVAAASSAKAPAPPSSSQSSPPSALSPPIQTSAPRPQSSPNNRVVANPRHANSSHALSVPFPSKLAPIQLPPRSSSTLQNALPPPPPPLPPPLPSPPPLPPMSVRRPPLTVTVQQASPLTPGDAGKRKGARIFSAEEKKILEANYAHNKFPSRLNMETLGKAMGKGTEKVRTWYNNRRALDRKLGVDVVRHHPDEMQSPRSFSTYPSKPVEDSVILPARVVSSPACLAASPHITPGKRAANFAEKLTHGSEESFVNVTPSSIAWAPSVSPMSSERHMQTVTSTPVYTHTNRFRISPLRIRNVRLILGAEEICGEISENLALDRGLEVKFLFGKKRVVYEWYCGQNYAEAQTTGGPYAKMEMNFSNVRTMQLVRGNTRSVLLLSFSVAPMLFLQTPESMTKYKVRAQQRQYRKVAPQEFPISINVEHHKILMRSDEAARVSKILIEDTPRLASIFEARTEAEPATQLATKSQAASGLAASQDVLIQPSKIAAPKIPDISPTPVRRRPLSVLELSSKQYPDKQDLVSSKGKRDSPASRPAERLHEQPIVRPTTADGAAANLLATPAPWHSPATPFASSDTLRRGGSVPWFTPSVAQTVSATPNTDRGKRREAQADAGHVRRELNFNNVHRTTAGPSPASVGSKRKAREATGDEHMGGDLSRRRLTPGISLSRKHLPIRIPEPPIPPQLPSTSGNTNVENQREANGGETNFNVNPSASSSGVLKLLPR